MTTLSKTQVDHLGDRLRKGPHSEADLRLLDDYRLSFGPAYDSVIQTLRLHSLTPTGRIKSTQSVVDKLRRESIRLTQIQDIAGCRVVVDSVTEQERLVKMLPSNFDHTALIDRRANPSHGYRSVHIIAQISKKSVEIQIRSSLQHSWAELSEKMSDVFDPAIKYGGGPKSLQNILFRMSDSIAGFEKCELKHLTLFEKFEIASAELLQTQDGDVFNWRQLIIFYGLTTVLHWTAKVIFRRNNMNDLIRVHKIHLCDRMRMQLCEEDHKLEQTRNELKQDYVRLIEYMTRFKEQEI